MTVTAPPAVTADACGDAPIRALVVARERLADWRLVQEWPVGSSRVDVAVIGDRLLAFEIKSAVDGFARLPTQVRDYSRVFDRVTLVGPLKQLARAQFLIPEWWGRTVVVDKGEGLALEVVRAPLLNPAQDPSAVLDLLWNRELRQLMQRWSLPAWKFGRQEMCQLLAKELPLDRVRRAVCGFLLARTDWHDLNGGQSSSAFTPPSRASGPERIGNIVPRALSDLLAPTPSDRER